MRKSFVFLLVSFAGVSTLSASVVYSITVNTSTLQGQAGFLDAQFNAGNTDFDLATATVSNFVTDGALAGSAALIGDVTPANAALPGTFSFTNDQFPNDLFQGITYGNLIGFTLTLSGPAVSSPNSSNTAGTAFSFSLYDSTGTQPLLTSSPDGAVAEVNVGPRGALSQQTFTTATGGSPVATITATPEPSEMGLFLSGIVGLWAARRRLCAA